MSKEEKEIKFFKPLSDELYKEVLEREGVQPKILKLKGNELGWIFKLAETHFDSLKFLDWIMKNKMQDLYDSLKLIMCKIHPNNFYAGDSDMEWILTNKKMSKSKPATFRAFLNTLNEKEQQRLKNFLKKHRKCFQTSDGSGFTYEISPCSIGTVVVIKCACGRERNVTDYSHW